MDTSMLIPMLERLGWTSLQTVLLVALVYLLCRTLPALSAATRCRLWWLVSLQAVVACCGANRCSWPGCPHPTRWQ